MLPSVLVTMFVTVGLGDDVCPQKHFLLVTVLEAGGCSQEALGKPGPHPLFVDQARATLVQLDADDVHMSSCCHNRSVGLGFFVWEERRGGEGGDGC